MLKSRISLKLGTIDGRSSDQWITGSVDRWIGRSVDRWIGK